MKTIEIKRAIRDFKQIAKDYLESHYDTHHNNLSRFFSFAYENEVIRRIIEPLMSMSVDLDNVFVTSNGFWIRQLNLPVNKNERIATVLQLMVMEHNREISFEKISHRMNPNEKSLPRLLALFNRDVVSPIFRDLFIILNDFVEDELEQSEEVAASVLNVFFGNINAQQGANVAIGNNITQTANYKSISEKLMDEVAKNPDIPVEQHSRIQEVAEEVEEELKSSEPNKPKLKSMVGRLFDIGRNRLLKLTKSIIEDPRWADAISDYFLDN